MPLYHSRDLIITLQEFYNLALVRRLDTGIAAGLAHCLSLLFQWEVVKLTTCVSTPSDIFILSEDAYAPANSHGSALVIT